MNILDKLPSPELTSFVIDPLSTPGLIRTPLSLELFKAFASRMSGSDYIKIVLDRRHDELHWINNHKYQFHADYIGDHVFGVGSAEVRSKIDEYNDLFYFQKDRPLFLGLIATTHYQGQAILFLETVEVDNMNTDELVHFFRRCQECNQAGLPLYLKLANLHQESMQAQIQAAGIPYLLPTQLYADRPFQSLRDGEVIGRLRRFSSQEEYRLQYQSIKWFDIICMDRVPDDIPQVSGILNNSQTSPLSHTNVLAHNWKIPNAIQVGIAELIEREELNGKWVKLKVSSAADAIELTLDKKPSDLVESIQARVTQIQLETPNLEHMEIEPLLYLRQSDRNTYGTKAANLGELFWIKNFLSIDLIKYYEKERPPRKNLLPNLAKLLNTSRVELDNLRRKAWYQITDDVHIPRGVALPFGVQQNFLKTYPYLQKTIAELKASLQQSDTPGLDEICQKLQQGIMEAPIPQYLERQIEHVFKEFLQGAPSLVVRSSSNAEDLPYFSAAGLYESVTNVTDIDNLFDSIKRVWASLISPRSVRLRHQYGLDINSTYMGVIIQAKIPCDIGGVMVTCNPFQREKDFRHVYLNVVPGSVESVVSGEKIANQYLFNTVEGGGATLSAEKDFELMPEQIRLMQKLALIGRMLQSHFNAKEEHETPLDIEWLIASGHLYILQARPYEG